MIKNLPSATKTNINDWQFEDLVLKDVLASTLCQTTIKPSANQIIIIDGHIAHNLVPDNLLVTVEDASIAIPVDNKLIQLNKDKKNSSIKITAPKNTIIKAPVSVVVVAKERSLVHQIEINLETGAELSLVESYLGIGNFNANITSKCRVGASANLTINTISNLHEGSVVYHHKQSEVAADGVCNVTNFIINDANMVFEDFTSLNGRGAQALVKTVSIASGNQKQNITVHVENIAENTQGNIINYGIVKDEAHLAFNGVGKIKKAAKVSDNQQETRILNLSKTAQAIANPFLLIDEGDITAGHAASIGQLDEEQLYYLMSRGLSRLEASKLVVLGFLMPFVDSLEESELKATLAKKIEKKLL